MRFYLDYNATAPLRPEARAAMLAALDRVGNPSSIHFEGRAARALVEEARREVAALAGASPRDVVFTASGTEAANLALAPGVSAPGVAPLARLIVSCDRARLRARRASLSLGRDRASRTGRPHRSGGAGAASRRRPAGAGRLAGRQQRDRRAAARRRGGGARTCARRPRSSATPCRSAGRLPLAEAARGADALLLSAHKFGGPKGAGAFVGLRQGLHVEPLLRGGGQERGRRAGTENVAAIAGFGAAARAAASGLAEEAARLAALRDACEARLRALAPEAVVFGAEAPRLPNTFAFALPGLAAGTLLMRLDLDGIAASSGSACSSGKVGPSHVLAAMGIAPALAAGAIRISLGWASGRGGCRGFRGGAGAGAGGDSGGTGGAA